jgi:hypothetical protein
MMAMTRTCVLLILGAICPFASAAEVQNVIVYRQPGRFGGWPANHGMWVWGNELLVGFSAGYMQDNGLDRHAIDHDKGEEHLLARSLDGGETWVIENPAAQGQLIPQGEALHGITPPGLEIPEWKDCPGGVDFAHPDFAMTLRMIDSNIGPSRWYYSLDRGHQWQGPFRFPQLDQPGIAARTDYIVNGPDDCLVFLTAAKGNRREGRPLCARTQDGGKNWNFVAWIAEEPSGYGIMPSTVRLGPMELLTAIRRHDDHRHWIETFRSPDNGKHWKPAGVPVPDTGFGNPGSLIRLADGRLALTYGVRRDPWRICARTSADAGQSWSDEIVLRDDGGCRDLGYTMSRQRADGKVVTTYYIAESHDSERYIGATIWQP